MSKVSEAIYSSGYGDVAVPLFGIECEIEAITRQPSMGGVWSMTDDGSLRNGGKEFISSPVILSSAIEAFGALHAQKFYIEAEAFSERTSIHVHMNCQGLDEQQVKNILLLYALYEECFFLMANPSRRFNIHRVPLTETHMPTFYGRPLNVIVDRWHKYTALNLLPLASQGTIEFRHMHGHSDQALHEQWLVVLANLFEAGKRETISKDFLTNRAELLRVHSQIFRGTKVFDITREAFDYYMGNAVTDVKPSLI